MTVTERGAAQMPRQFVIRIRRDRLSLRINRRSLAVSALLLLALLALSVTGLGLGSLQVSIPDIVSAFAGTASPALETVVIEWRLPRILLAAAFGAALGLSGTIFQSFTRNALGSPDVIGFSTGSYTGVLLVMLFGGAGFIAISLGALAGGFATALAVYLFAYKRGMQGFRLIIIGIAVSSMLMSLNNWITVKADVSFAMQAAVWGAGTLNGIGWKETVPSILTLTVLCMLLAVASPLVSALELGDDLATLQGVRVERSKIAVMVLGVAFIAVVTAVAGPIAFVALAAPQVARRLTGPSASVGLVPAALTGALLLAGADLLAQHAIPGVVLPTGAVTVCLGGTYLVWLLARHAKKES